MNASDTVDVQASRDELVRALAGLSEQLEISRTEQRRWHGEAQRNAAEALRWRRSFAELLLEARGLEDRARFAEKAYEALQSVLGVTRG